MGKLGGNGKDEEYSEGCIHFSVTYIYTSTISSLFNVYKGIDYSINRVWKISANSKGIMLTISCDLYRKSFT